MKIIKVLNFLGKIINKKTSTSSDEIKSTSDENKKDVIKDQEKVTTVIESNVPHSPKGND